jgi:hypothetical protein
MSEMATSSHTPNGDKPPMRVLEKWDLLSQVLDFLGEGTEIALMSVCKDVCKFVRLLRGWQKEEKKEKRRKRKKISKITIVSRVSGFLFSAGLTEWGVDVLDMPMTKKTPKLAVKGGYVSTLSWLLSRDVPLERRSYDGVCCWAAERGHLSMLQYIRSQTEPCPWDEWTCWNADENGHLHVLQWARSQPEPCPWNKWTCAYAALNGHVVWSFVVKTRKSESKWSEHTKLRCFLCFMIGIVHCSQVGYTATLY